ncbi:MAG: Nickel uptake substrate-specific transmembrane region [Deltaproteobacteria bacterium ADurb.BinA179]|nr:MAG: Nickel uptake substrate-specific transmembrane region [Deltaproteobacteria bacterium ADurb.BinA179]
MRARSFFIACAFVLVFLGAARAHFGMIIPSDDLVTQGDARDIAVKLGFAHPFETQGLTLEKPERFEVWTRDGKTDLLKAVHEIKFLDHKAWETTFKVRQPGVYIFSMEPKPYFEPAEDCYIIHYTKTVVSAFGLEEGWDRELGLKTEIVPLTRPFGLYAGNVFQGVVKLNGRPVPFCEVEVEYFNENRKYAAPSESFITQVVKTDAGGVFTYAAPRPGWWGFAALNASDEKIKGKNVELGAVLWVKFHEMK